MGYICASVLHLAVERRDLPQAETKITAVESHQYLTNVQCCNRHNHGQTIHPTEIFISMNLLQTPCMVLKDHKNPASNLRKK